MTLAKLAAEEMECMERTMVWKITRRLERLIMAEKAAVAKVAPNSASVVVLMLNMLPRVAIALPRRKKKVRRAIPNIEPRVLKIRARAKNCNVSYTQHKRPHSPVFLFDFAPGGQHDDSAMQ
jgi:hypothetical protein